MSCLPTDREKGAHRLDRSAGDEEPLVNAAVDRGGGKVLARGDLGEGSLVGKLCRAFVGDIGPREC
jgi:hypothetical protein